MNILKFIELCIQEGGGSYNLMTGDTNPEFGYMVAQRGTEVRSRYLTKVEVMDFIAQHHLELCFEDNYLGIWYHEDKWYMDVAKNISNFDDAIASGKANQQKAIWDCVLNQEIILK